MIETTTKHNNNGDTPATGELVEMPPAGRTSVKVLLLILNLVAFVMLVTTMASCSLLKDTLPGSYDTNFDMRYGLFLRDTMDMEQASDGYEYAVKGTCKPWTQGEKDDLFGTSWIAARVFMALAVVSGAVVLVAALIVMCRRVSQEVSRTGLFVLHFTTFAFALITLVGLVGYSSLCEDFRIRSGFDQCLSKATENYYYAPYIKSCRCVEEEKEVKRCEKCLDIGYCSLYCHQETTSSSGYWFAACKDRCVSGQELKETQTPGLCSKEIQDLTLCPVEPLAECREYFWQYPYNITHQGLGVCKEKLCNSKDDTEAFEECVEVGYCPYHCFRIGYTADDFFQPCVDECLDNFCQQNIEFLEGPSCSWGYGPFFLVIAGATHLVLGGVLMGDKVKATFVWAVGGILSIPQRLDIKKNASAPSGKSEAANPKVVESGTH